MLEIRQSRPKLDQHDLIGHKFVTYLKIMCKKVAEKTPKCDF